MDTSHILGEIRTEVLYEILNRGAQIQSDISPGPLNIVLRSSVRNFLHVTPLAPTALLWRLEFW